jgi:DnaJ like chaperone protein
VKLGDHAGKIVGFAAGTLGGWFGAIIGLLLGTMFDAIAARLRTDKAVAAYLEQTGPAGFEERESGAAALAALVYLIIEADGTMKRREETVAVARAARIAESVLGTDSDYRPELESFARAAAALGTAANPDLLAESLCARRRNAGDGDAIAARLAEISSGPRGDALVDRIASIIAPEFRRLPASGPAAGDEEAYRLLGLARGASIDEIKTSFRKLAVQFHPDGLARLGSEQEKKAAEAFIRIEAAYRRILRNAEDG